MNQLQKSIELLEKFFAESSDEEVGKTLDYFNNLDFDGPTWPEYIAGFEKEYENLYLLEVENSIIEVNSDPNCWTLNYSESQSLVVENLIPSVSVVIFPECINSNKLLENSKIAMAA